MKKLCYNKTGISLVMIDEVNEMIQFYCYARCSTCKKAQKFLEQHGVNFEWKDIQNHDLSPEEIQKLHEKSGLPLRRIFNTSGMLYRELNLKDRLDTMSLQEAYELLSRHGMLLKRPILISSNHVLFGFKEENYQQVIKDVTRKN